MYAYLIVSGSHIISYHDTYDDAYIDLKEYEKEGKDYEIVHR